MNKLLYLILSFIINASVFCEANWMWHGSFPWVYSDADNEWWYMHAGNDGLHYAFRNKGKEWYVYSQNLNDWAPANLSFGVLDDEAKSYLLSGDFNQSLESYSKAYAVSVHKYGLNNPKGAEALYGIGKAFEGLGKYQYAFENHTKALEIRRSYFGNTHTLVTDSLTELGKAENSLGRYEDALRTHQIALKFRLENLGSTDSKIAETHNQIAKSQLSLDMFYDAYASLQKAMGIMLAADNPDKKIFSETYFLISIWQLANGDFEKALQNGIKSLNLNEKVFGEDHPVIGSNFARLSRIYQAIGDYEKALEFSRKSLLKIQNTLGETHPWTGFSYGNLAFTNALLLDESEALSYDQKYLEILIETLGQDHPETGFAYYSLSLSQMSSDPVNARINFLKGLDNLSNSLGNNHSVIFQMKSILESMNYGSDAWNQSNAQKALEKNLAKVIEVYGKDHFKSAEPLKNLGYFYSRNQQESKGIDFSQKALSIASLSFDEGHPSMGAFYKVLGHSYYNIKDYENSQSNYKKALEVLKDFGARIISQQLKFIPQSATII